MVTNKEIQNKIVSASESHQFYHPASGLVILMLDYIFFTGEVMVITAPVAIFLLFIVAFFTLFTIQVKLYKDSIFKASLKAFVGAIVTAIPTPIAGTLMGTIILTLSGIKKKNNNK